MPSDAARYTDPKVTSKTLKRRIGQKATSEPGSVLHGARSSPTATVPTVKETAPTPAKLSARPLQPTTNKRKQQAAGVNSQDAHSKSKKAKSMSTSTSTSKADMQQKSDQPETFESVSTAHQDDTEQIRHVKEIVQKGLGLPRIRSCEYFK
jgi:hypothetical protein